MKLFWRSLIAILLLALGFWLWTVVFPSPEKVIRKRLHELAAEASVHPQEGDLARALNVASLASYFASEVELNLQFQAYAENGVFTPDQLLQGGLAVRSQMPGLKLEFLDLVISLAPDKQSATVGLTMKASQSRPNEFGVQEMKFGLRKVNGRWLIHRVETIKTLSRKRTRLAEDFECPRV